MSLDIKSDRIGEKRKLEERCGEIYMTVERNIILYCTLCELKFNNFGEYDSHLDKHYPATLKDSIFIEQIEIKHEHTHYPGLYPEDETEVLVPEITNISTTINEYSTKLKDIEIVPAQINFSNLEEEPTNIGQEQESTHQDVERKPVSLEFRPLRKKRNYFANPGEFRRYLCTHCPSTFKYSASLRKHVLRHTTQKTHKCPQCPKLFYAPLDVKKHLQVHSGERKFLCPICGITCLTGSKLKDHMRRHTNQRDYKCMTCEKRFYNAGLLACHMQVHSGERHHECTICKSKFTYRKGLRNHMKLHENKRGYKCELCDASFNQQAGLFSHMKNKHKSV